jgi:hypothetical protein
MKTMVALFIGALTANTCSAQYIDLGTGKTVTLVKHNGNGMMYNTQTQRPVYIYIDPTTNDTFYGRTREKINGRIVLHEGKYMYTGDEAYIYADGDYRLKTEADSTGYKRKMHNDGDMKVKYGDVKRKTEADGDTKIKHAGGKMKMNSNGTMKVKDTSAYRKKIDEDGNYREKDDSAKVKMKADGSMKVKDKRSNYKGKIDDDGTTKEKNGKTKNKSKDNKVKTKSEAARTDTLQ